MVAAVSDAVEESSVDAQELTPSVRTDTRTRMSRKYLRKLKMDIILLHEGIKNLNYSVSIILPNKPLVIANSRTEFHICQHFFSWCRDLFYKNRYYLVTAGNYSKIL